MSSDPERITSFPEYCEAALRTADDLPPPDYLKQGALGLPDEWREYCEVRGSGDLSDEAAAELGDCFWYAALVATGYCQLTGERPLQDEPESTVLGPHFRRLSGAVEDYCYQEKTGAIETIGEELSAIVWLLYREACGGALAVMRYNLAKLGARYPDGWESGGGRRGG